MIKVILSDFARVILFPKDKSYLGRLDELQAQLNSELQKYNFFDYFELNHELLNYLKSLKGTVLVNIFTSGDNYKTSEIQDSLIPVFENFFYSKELGIKKDDPQAYQLIAEKLKSVPGEIYFIDDDLENIEAAKKAGVKTHLYENNDLLLADLNPLLSLQ